jgi:PAS domain S-box-containing protein
MHNDYQALPERKDYPAGHVHLVRHLGVPVIEDGDVRLLIGVGNKATDYDGADIQQLQMISIDIWGVIMRHRAEVGLAAAHAHARLIFDSSADGILQIDEKGCIAEINPAACQILGYASDELLGRDVHAAIHCSRDPRTPLSQASCSLGGAMRAGLALREDNETFWRADGSPLPVTVASHPIYPHSLPRSSPGITPARTSTRPAPSWRRPPCRPGWPRSPGRPSRSRSSSRARVR